MSQPWLILDVSGLAYRSFYSVGDLSYEGISTGIVFGMFKSVLDMMEVHATQRVCWCFDAGHDCRSAIYPAYKANRKPDEDEAKTEARRELRRQLYRLRIDYLPAIGFHNIFSQDGYEADDVIASVVQSMASGQESIIVSTDHDLFQLISHRVSIWNPVTKTLITRRSFLDEWGIGPDQWPDVLAIAGCSGDNVVGVDGVGEKSAVKFLSGNLKDTSAKHRAIVAGNNLWRRNLELVRLPFAGCKRFELVDDGSLDFEPVFERLGMASLRGRGRRRVV